MAGRRSVRALVEGAPAGKKRGASVPVSGAPPRESARSALGAPDRPRGRWAGRRTSPPPPSRSGSRSSARRTSPGAGRWSPGAGRPAAHSREGLGCGSALLVRGPPSAAPEAGLSAPGRRRRRLAHLVRPRARRALVAPSNRLRQPTGHITIRWNERSVGCMIPGGCTTRVITTTVFPSVDALAKPAGMAGGPVVL